MNNGKNINKNKRINIKIIIISIVIVLAIILVCLYKFNYPFRQAVNNLITLKANTNANVPMINIDKNNINAIFGYDEYFAILKQNIITGYTKEQAEFENMVSVTNPIYETQGKYLVIAENRC